MKPIKNRTFCLAIGRPKMLFKTKKNADTCIKFNEDEMFQRTGRRPCRSYYCVLCGGWHITSDSSARRGKRVDERVNAEIQMYYDWKERLRNKKQSIQPEKAIVLSSFYKK